MKNQLKKIMNPESIERKIMRISHEIMEDNFGENPILVGIHTRGFPLANRIKNNIQSFAGVELLIGSLDINFHRDDYRSRSLIPELKATDINFSIEQKSIILVDDVLYTGRTIRAAIEGLISFGRPKLIKLAVLVDRGHRELPIRADYIGNNIPTHDGEHINVNLSEIDKEDGVFLIRDDNE